MEHKDRLTYETLKAWALECFYEGCRDQAVVKGLPHEQILGYVDYQFEDSFELPVEQFMWRVVLLILSGGWYQDWYLSARQIVADQIQLEGIDEILAGVPEAESEMFRHDLKILKLI